jgi:hypothetical protein
MVYICDMRKIRMNVFLDPKQKQALERLSSITGTSVAELIRCAVDAYPDVYHKKLYRALKKMEKIRPMIEEWKSKSASKK